jgi:FkbM family methyltransferase
MSFHGQWSPPVDEVLLRNYFPAQRQGTFVECGAGDGVIDSCCLFFEELGWRGINLEPCPGMFLRLKLNRPRAVNLQVSLSDHDGVAKFSITEDGNGAAVGGVTGIWHPKWRAELASRGYRFRSAVASTRTFRSLMESLPAPAPVDLCVIDVDGHELQVLDGMAGAPLPGVLCIEYPLVGLGPLTQRLSGFGYQRDFVSFNNAFFRLGRSVVPDGGWFGRTEVMAW